MVQIIPNYNVAISICNALGLDPTLTGRIIIDIDVDSPVKVYVEMYGTTSLLDIDWSRGLKGASIVCNDSTVAREDKGETVDKVD